MQVNSHTPVNNQAVWIWFHISTSFAVSPGSRELSCVCSQQFVCYYTSSSTLHSTTSGRGILGSTLGWPEGMAIPLGQSKHWESHARAKQPLQTHLPPQRCLDSSTHNLSLSTAGAVQRGGLYVPKSTNELFGLPAEFFISSISFWEFFKMIL